MALFSKQSTPYLDSPSTATPVMASALNSWDQTLFELNRGLGLSVRQFVTGTGDETAALQAAVDEALGTGQVLVGDPTISVDISAKIDMRGNGLRYVGNGMPIRQNTANTPGVAIGGQDQVVTGVTVDYAATPSSTDTNANAFELSSVFKGFYSGLKAERCGRGFAMLQAGWAGDTANTVFSSVFQNIFVSGYTVQAMDMRSWPIGGASSTGCVFSNLYLQNNYFGPVAVSDQTPVVFQDWDESHFQQLNVEWVETSNDLTFWQRCRNMVFDSVHFEGVKLNGTAGLFRPYESTVLNARGVSWVNSTLVADGGRKSVVRPGQGGTTSVRMDIEGLRLRTLTTSGVTAFCLADLDSDITVSRFEFTRADTGPLIGPAVVGDHPAAPAVQRINDRLYGPLSADANRLSVGQSTMPRDAVTSNTAANMTSGTMRLAFFTAEETFTATQMRLICGGTAATATPTLVRAGIYSVAKDGSLTLVAAIASDTSIFAATLTAYSRPFSTAGGLPASLPIVAGTRYAIGILVTSGVAVPALPGANALIASEFAQTPRISGTVTGQTDLPTSVAAASITDSTARCYAAVLP
jgi:hypothetical protein